MESNHIGDANFTGSPQELQYGQQDGMEWGQQESPQMQAMHQHQRMDMSPQMPMYNQQQSLNIMPGVQHQQSQMQFQQQQLPTQPHVQHQQNQMPAQQQNMQRMQHQQPQVSQMPQMHSPHQMQHQPMQPMQQPQMLQQQQMYFQQPPQMHSYPMQQMQQSPQYTHPAQPFDFPQSSQTSQQFQFNGQQQYPPVSGGSGYPPYSPRPVYQQSYQQPPFYQRQPFTPPSSSQQTVQEYLAERLMRGHDLTRPNPPRISYQTQFAPPPKTQKQKQLQQQQQKQQELQQQQLKQQEQQEQQPQQPTPPPQPPVTGRPVASTRNYRGRRTQPSIQSLLAGAFPPTLRGSFTVDIDSHGEETVKDALSRRMKENAKLGNGSKAFDALNLRDLAHNNRASSSQSTQSSSQPSHYSLTDAKTSKALPSHLESTTTPPPPPSSSSSIAPPSSPLSSQSSTATLEITKQQDVIFTPTQPREGGDRSLLIPCSADTGMEERSGETRNDGVAGQEGGEQEVVNRNRVLMAALIQANESAVVKSNGQVEIMSPAALHRAGMVAQSLYSKQNQQQPSSSSRKRPLPSGDYNASPPLMRGHQMESNENGGEKAKTYLLVRRCNENDEEHNPNGILKTVEQVMEDRNKSDVLTVCFASHKSLCPV